MCLVSRVTSEPRHWLRMKMSILEKGRSRSKYNQTLDEIHGLNYANIGERSNTSILFLRVHAMRQPADSASTGRPSDLVSVVHCQNHHRLCNSSIKGGCFRPFLSFFTGSVTCFVQVLRLHHTLFLCREKNSRQWNR